MIESLGHVGLSVSDMEKSLEFYRDHLGMKVLMELDVQDERIGRLVGIAGTKCKITHLQLGNGVLELFEYTQPRGNNIARDMRQCDHGISHFGFEVSDFHTHIEKLRERNVEFLGEPVEFRKDVWVAYFRGPDGEVVEFRQQPASASK